MKTLRQYISETEKKYGFRVKIAEQFSKEQMESLQKVLARWNLEAISEPKHLPVSEDHTGFLHLKATDLYMIDLVVQYPATPAEIQAAIHEATQVSLSRILVLSPNQEILAAPMVPEADGQAILEKNYPEQKAPQLLADLANAIASTSIEYPFAVKPTVGKTSNDFPQSNTSPVGTRKNKLPPLPSRAGQR
jgi:hypothetical protein